MQRSSFPGASKVFNPLSRSTISSPSLTASPPSSFVVRCQKEPPEDRKDNPRYASTQSHPYRPRFRRTANGAELTRGPSSRSPNSSRGGGGGGGGGRGDGGEGSSSSSSSSSSSPGNGTSERRQPSRYSNSSSRNRYNNNNGGGSATVSHGNRLQQLQQRGNAGKHPLLRRWLSHLARQLKDILAAAEGDDIDAIDPEVIKKVLAAMPEATSAAERQEAVLRKRYELERSSSSSVGNKATATAQLETEEEEESDAEDEADASEAEDDAEKEVEAPPATVYDAELAAILQHYNSQVVEKKEEQRQKQQKSATRAPKTASSHTRKTMKQSGGGGEESNDDDEEGEEEEEEKGSKDSNWRPQIGEGSLSLLVRLIADSASPQTALLLYNILDGASTPSTTTVGASSFPTRTPRFLGSMVRLLVKKDLVEGAYKLMRKVIVSSGAAAAAGRVSDSASYEESGGDSSSGSSSSNGGKWSESWEALSRGGRPDLVQDLISELRRFGIDPGADEYLCLVGAHARNKNVNAALTAFHSMRNKGLETSWRVYFMLVQAASEMGDVELAMKVLYWAEQAALKDSTFRLLPVWRALLGMAISSGAPSGLRERLVGRLAKQGRRIPCDTLSRVICKAFQEGNGFAAIALFQLLRSQRLIAGLPIVPSLNTISRDGYSIIGGGDGGVVATPPATVNAEKMMISISGLDYEQIVSSSSSTSAAAGGASMRKNGGGGGGGPRRQNSIRQQQQQQQQGLSSNKIISAATAAATVAAPVENEIEIESDEDELESEEDELDAAHALPALVDTNDDSLVSDSEEEVVKQQQRQQGEKEEEDDGADEDEKESSGRSPVMFFSTASGPSSPDAALALYEYIIIGAHKTRLDESMQKCYGWMHDDGLVPSRQIMNRIAASVPYGQGNIPKTAVQIYSYMRKLGVPLDGYTYGHIISALMIGPDGRSWWSTALLLLHRMHMSVATSHDTSVQTSMVVAAGRNGWVPELLTLYKLMLQDGVMPRSITWNAFITAAVRCSRPDLGFEFGSAMRQMGCCPDAATYSALLSCAAALRDGPAAHRQWQNMQDDGVLPDCIACTSYMWACICGGEPQSTIQFFESWRQNGKPPGWDPSLAPPAGKYNLNAAIGRTSGMGAFSSVSAAIPRASTLSPGSLTFSQICSAVMRSGRWEASRSALQLQRWIKNQGGDPRVLSLDQLRMKAAEKGGRWVHVVAVAEDLAKLPKPPSPFPPDAVAIAFAVTSYSQLGERKMARQLADELAAMDLPLESTIFSTALDGCGVAGNIDAAMKLLRRARAAGLRVDRAAYGAAIMSAAQDGNVATAMNVLRWMLDDGVFPNIIVINSVLSVCVAAGDADTALNVYWRMESEWGITPDAIACATLCEVLGKNGRWGEAVQIMALAESSGLKLLKEPYYPTRVLEMGAKDPPSLSIDLHGFSIAGAGVVIRAWLLLLQRSPAVAGGGLDAKLATIVTGRGRNSKEGVSRLRPFVEELVGGGGWGASLGHRLSFVVPQNNPGCLEIPVSVLREEIAHPELDLGLGGEKEMNFLWKILTGKVLPPEFMKPRSRA